MSKQCRGCWGEIIDFWRVWKIYLFELCEWGAWCSKIRYMVICHQLKVVFSSMYVFISVFIVIFTSPTSYKDKMEWRSKQTSIEYHASRLQTTNSLVSFSQIFYLFNVEITLTSCQQTNKQHQTSFVKPKLLPLTPLQWFVRERQAANKEWKY